ncbi:hypothetical protein Cgig2_015006 [Carnegiea gigantea]|uniref:Uncharacterized protein n=1 Tax=Carnegiea gigantea TaxID=171969 RepID=A0A9Q1JE85_9CARY|nr:hypothetical protein Cgig2_015006 [Carnegiea gigantea]
MLRTTSPASSSLQKLQNLNESHSCSSHHKMRRNRKTRLQNSTTPCPTNGSQSPPEHANFQLMSPSNGHPSHPKPSVCVQPPITLPPLSNSQPFTSPMPHNFSSFFHTTSSNMATSQPWVSPSASSTHLQPLGSLGNESHLMKHSSFVQTLPYTPTFATKFQPQVEKPSPSILNNDQLSPSSHNSQLQPPFSPPMPSRYIHCQSPDSNSQSQPSSNEAEETHSDDEDESNAMTDDSNLAQDPTVDHESFGKVVEIVDESGNVTKKKDFKSKDIHSLRDGDRVLVQFNSVGQPIGDSRSALSRWMVSFMKEPNLCPRDAKDFKEVMENCGAELLRNLRLKFLIPKHVDVEKALTDIFGIKFRSMRHEQNKHTFSNKLKVIFEET